MAASLSIIAGKDGNGTTIAGGLQALDLSGGGTGPWSLANILVDGVAGSNRLNVTAANAMKVDGSAVTQPVSISGNQAVNLTQVAGAAIAQGHGTAATAIRVELPTDGTGLVNAAQSGSWSSKIWDGTNQVTVRAASTGNAVATDVALVCTLRDMNPNGATTASASAPITLPTDAAATTVAVTPTVTAAAYTANNEVGGLMTFSSAGRTPGTSGVVQDVTLTSKTVQTSEFDLYLFDSNPSSSTWTDKTAPAINVADVGKIRGVVKLTKNYSGLGTHTVYKPDETTFAPIVFSGATLYGVLVTPGTPTFGSTSDLTITLGII